MTTMFFSKKITNILYDVDAVKKKKSELVVFLFLKKYIFETESYTYVFCTYTKIYNKRVVPFRFFG